MFLGAYYDDAFQCSRLSSVHALSVPLNLAMRTLHNVLQYESVTDFMRMDEDCKPTRHIVSSLINTFRVTATLHNQSMRCVNMKQFALLCSANPQNPVQPTSDPLHHLRNALHPETLELYQHTLTELDDFDKFTTDYS